MSSISAQYNLLQTLAAVLVVHDRPDMAAIVRDTADNLLELRDDLQRANAENAKLRELVREVVYARDDADWASIVSTAIALGVEVVG